jgi:UDP-N-acetylmuramoyl-L-alanyl-D-glutamate--2,6-diaminopimelate ligase
VPPLDGLLGGLDVVAVDGDPATDVRAVAHDHRTVTPGALYCCVRGQRTDGHAHAPAAVRRGAVALLVDRRLDLGVPQVRVADVRRAMGPVAAAFHGHPSRALDVVGVTGTNGKTTTTAFLRSALEAAGRRTRVIGTLGGARTTPEAPELQALLGGFRDEGASAVAMEVSSHALALHRVEGTDFAAAVFTNLSRDHLDFHASMEDYFAAKARLFEPERAALAVVNADDAHGRLLADAARVPTVRYSLADVHDLVVDLRSSRGTWRGRRLVVPLGGAFNMANALAAATTAVELGADAGDVVEGVARVTGVPGRFEPVDLDAPFSVVVDYAHTPDGLDRLLRAAREVADGRVLVVFGCGGDRDRVKRPAMGEVASRLADLVVLTSDNPRSEDPLDILAAVSAGVRGPAPVTVEADRRTAIALALAEAGAGDVVVVAGKGHETTQDFGRRSVPFDDRLVVAEEWARQVGGDR